METYIDLVLDIFDDTGQRAAVDSRLTVAQMIDEILREFEGLDQQNPDLYALSLVGSNTPLDRNHSLTDQNVHPGDRLVFTLAQKALGTARKNVTQPSAAAFQDVASEKMYLIEWQPARIGRRDVDPVHNELLLIDFDWHSNGRRVSRQHAQVTEREGIYYLEGLATQNPIRVNGIVLLAGQSVQLNAGDSVELGQSGILLRFILFSEKNKVRK